MPRCLDCGNEVSFCSSRVEPAAPTANGPISGLIADFDDENHIIRMERLDNNQDNAREAWEKPWEYFDMCFICGSNRITWDQ